MKGVFDRMNTINAMMFLENKVQIAVSAMFRKTCSANKN